MNRCGSKPDSIVVIKTAARTHQEVSAYRATLSRTLWVEEADKAGRMTYYEREDRQKGVHHRFRFVNEMPLNEANADLKVNFIECWETVKGKVQHFSWITDLCVNKGTVYRIMQGARARWRIENETFNTLKNQGYHFEHNFGHGYVHLSVVFASLMMLAFLVDQVQQLCCPLFQAA